MAQYPPIHETDTKHHSGAPGVNNLCVFNVHPAIMSQTSCPQGSLCIVVAVAWRNKTFLQMTAIEQFFLSTLALVAHLWSRRVHRPSISVCFFYNHCCGERPKRAVWEPKKYPPESDQQSISLVSKWKAILGECPCPITFCSSFSSQSPICINNDRGYIWGYSSWYLLLDTLPMSLWNPFLSLSPQSDSKPSWRRSTAWRVKEYGHGRGDHGLGISHRLSAPIYVSSSASVLCRARGEGHAKLLHFG